MQLSCRSLDIGVGATAIDVGALARQKILLKKPAEGDATIRFTGRDWDYFLMHPQMTESIATLRTASASPPDVAFLARGGTQLVQSGSVVAFPVRVDGVELDARLSQRPDGTVECTAKPTAAAASTDAPAADVDTRAAAAAVTAGPWLARLFSTLVIDLDGCALTFRSLRVEPGAVASQPELVLELAVRVRSFPSLDINF